MQRSNLAHPFAQNPLRQLTSPQRQARWQSTTPDPESELQLPNPKGAVRACFSELVGETPASIMTPSAMIIGLWRANATGYLANSPV